MKSITKTAHSIFTIFSLTALAACGGGGGSASPAVPTTPPPASMLLQPSTIITSGGTSTYTAGSDELDAFNLLNQERKNCGFGILAQNSKLDQSATSHSKFLVENNLAYSHYEATGLPFFTGVTETDRATAVGYTNPVAAVLATWSGSPAGNPPSAIEQVRKLLAAPYHSAGMVDNYAEVGVGYSKKQLPPIEKRALNITMGSIEGVNDLAPDQVYTYPCAGSAGVLKGLVNETPNPIPLNLVQDYTKYGTPIIVKVRAGKVLKITSVTLIPAAGGAAIATTVVDQINDPQQGALMLNNTAYVLPMVPLLPQTTYTFTISGTSDGVVFNKTLAQPFTTGQ
jgi:uncharacterized protein YkwD